MNTQSRKAPPGMIYRVRGSFSAGDVTFHKMKEFAIESAKDLSTNYMTFNSLAELREYQRQQKPQ